MVAVDIRRGYRDREGNLWMLELFNCHSARIMSVKVK
jgi:hypothetical protein